MQETVTITNEEYMELLNTERELNALKCNGVKQWDGYNEVLLSLEDDNETDYFDYY